MGHLHIDVYYQEHCVCPCVCVCVCVLLCYKSISKAAVQSLQYSEHAGYNQTVPQS